MLFRCDVCSCAESSHRRRRDPMVCGTTFTVLRLSTATAGAIEDQADAERVLPGSHVYGIGLAPQEQHGCDAEPSTTTARPPMPRRPATVAIAAIMGSHRRLVTPGNHPSIGREAGRLRFVPRPGSAQRGHHGARRLVVQVPSSGAVIRRSSGPGASALSARLVSVVFGADGQRFSSPFRDGPARPPSCTSSPTRPSTTSPLPFSWVPRSGPRSPGPV